eukprot:jgi/Ulvmu1/11342/UM075_0002.1
MSERLHRSGSLARVLPAFDNRRPLGTSKSSVDLSLSTSHDGEVPQVLEPRNGFSAADDRVGTAFLVDQAPSRLRKFLTVVSHRLFMSIWNKASKWTRSSTRAAKAYIGKKFSVCLYPVVLEPVYLRLVPYDASAHVQDGFKESIQEFLRRSGFDVQWVEGGETLTILLHQPGQRLDPAPVVQTVCSLEAAGSPVFVVFMLPHNPALRTLPSGARDMTDHHNFRKLEQSVRGCTEWYFWHMCATQQQEDRLQALNMPASAALLREVKTLAEPPTRIRPPPGRRAGADVAPGEAMGLMPSQTRTAATHTATHTATSAASSLRFHVP